MVEAAALFAEHFVRLGELMQTLASSGYDLRRVKPQQHAGGPVEFVGELVGSITDLLGPDEERFAIPVEDVAGMLLGLGMSLRFDPNAADDRRARIRQRVDVLLHGAQRNPPPSNDEPGRAR